MNKPWIAVAVVSLLVVSPFVQAQTNTPASDNPTAGLNLGDSKSGSSSELSPFAQKFGNNLVALKDGQVKNFDGSSLSGIKYWAFYYSASWCGPCRAFTPKLVEFYKEFKATHPNFELVHVNDDQTADDMGKYMLMDDMPWPAVRFDDIKKTDLKKYCGPGIPDLVLTDENGKVLADSFAGQDYRGPQAVVEDIKKIVK